MGATHTSLRLRSKGLTSSCSSRSTACVENAWGWCFVSWVSQSWNHWGMTRQTTAQNYGKYIRFGAWKSTWSWSCSFKTKDPWGHLKYLEVLSPWLWNGSISLASLSGLLTCCQGMHGFWRLRSAMQSWIYSFPKSIQLYFPSHLLYKVPSGNFQPCLSGKKTAQKWPLNSGWERGQRGQESLIQPKAQGQMGLSEWAVTQRRECSVIEMW